MGNNIDLSELLEYNALTELIKYADRQIKINNTLIALKEVNFEEIKIWQEFWKEVYEENSDFKFRSQNDIN